MHSEKDASPEHRNLKNLKWDACMHAGRSNPPKFVVLDMARLIPSKNTKNNIWAVNDLPSQSDWTTPTLNLPWFTRKIVSF
jgi:hypothetical protein